MNIKPEIKEKIITTANALVAEGVESPTNDQVRERMKGGSLSHISPVMREWRDAKKEAVEAALEMPPELRKVIESSVGQVWTAASKLAAVSVETIRLESDAAINAVTGERDEALSEIGRLEERIAELQKSLAEKDKTINHVQEKLENERLQSTKLASDNAVLIAKTKEKDEQIKALKAELKESRDDNKELQRELIEIAKKEKK